MKIEETIERNPIEVLMEIVKKNKDCILVTRHCGEKETQVCSYIIRNHRLKFISCNSPSFSAFVDKYNIEVMQEVFKRKVFGELVYDTFDGEFTYNKLIKFSKEYDRKYNGSSTKFYKKYKDMILQYI